MIALTRDEIERFETKVDRQPGHGPNRDCHVWTASLNAGGYGQVQMRRIQAGPIRAHRLAFFLAYGREPDPQCLHRCDNRACVNPAHLFEGTNADNVADKVAKGRSAKPYAKLTDETVAEIKRLVGSVTQRELARRFGVAQATVNRVARKKASAC